MPKKFTQKQIIIIGAAVLFVLIGGVVFLLNIRSSAGGTAALKLTIWGTDSQKAMNDVIQSYTGPGSGTTRRSNIRRSILQQYQSKLLAALAAGTGPDIFEIPNRDLSQWAKRRYADPRHARDDVQSGHIAERLPGRCFE